MATTTRPVTSLDFDSIKADIISFIKTNPTFTDYNFEGSALNAIADMLAYNTYNNAYYASMLHSEGFLDTAQKRESVVSRAKELGYTPKSCACSTAYVNLTVIGAAAQDAITIPRGLSFSSSNENGAYTFITATDSTGVVSGGNQVFNSLKLLNGVNVTNTFVVDTSTNVRGLFSIPNPNIDISTLRVFVRDSVGSLSRVEYTLAQNAYGLLPTSNAFFIQESYDGRFQIFFGNDVIGIQPVSGNVIEIDYILTDTYTDGDGCRVFGFGGTIGSISAINIVTTQVSFGGAYKEDINSIKANAIKSNSAKQRSVTTDDYELLLKEKFNYIKSVAIWGGEDNLPPVYGKVFLSIQPVSGVTISDALKRDVILPVIKKYSLMTITPQIIDPNYVNLEFTSYIKFNPSKTVSTQFAVEGLIKSAITDYVSSISKFNTDYLHSNLVASIIGIDPGIVSVNINKAVGFRISPLIGVSNSFSNSVNNSIISGTIHSTKFNVFSGGVPVSVSIKEIPNGTSYTIDPFGVTNQINRLGLYNDSGVLVSDIGSVNIYTGIYDLTLNVSSYISSNRFIQISCTLASDDIITSRNQILLLEPLGEDSSIGLYPNNIVVTEVYNK